MKELFRVPAENLAVDYLVKRGDIVLQPSFDGEMVVYDNLPSEEVPEVVEEPKPTVVHGVQSAFHPFTTRSIRYIPATRLPINPRNGHPRGGRRI